MDSDMETKLISLISQLQSDGNTNSEDVSFIIQIISLVRSIDVESEPKPESEFMLLVTQAISAFNSMDLDSQPKPLLDLVSAISVKLSMESDSEPESDTNFMSLVNFIAQRSLEPEPKFISLIHQILSLSIFSESESETEQEGEDDWLDSLLSNNQRESLDSDLEKESKLISLITQIISINISWMSNQSKIISCVAKIISLVVSMDLDLESELKSLIKQTLTVFNSMDLDSQPKPLSELIVLVTQHISLGNSTNAELEQKFGLLVDQTLHLEPEPKLVSLIYQIFSLVISFDSEPKKLLSLCPQGELRFEEGKFYEVALTSKSKWECLPGMWEKITSTGEGYTHFLCRGCNGRNHEEYEKAPAEIKHPLHPKHFLHLALMKEYDNKRKCYCCVEYIQELLYYCPACDFGIDFTCVGKRLVLSIDQPKWHEHPLALFPSQASFTCNLCALKHTDCPFYICPPCDFVAHQRCLSLPRVIRISRYPYRISFTPSFGQGDWSCDVCRRKIDNDYGGYSCTKIYSSYVAHSRCATQLNIWDGIDLYGVSEDIEEEILEPFVRISDGVIEHFTHKHHHLRLDERNDTNYDGNQLCQICITPIYSGGFYSCIDQCEFILHENCANLPRKTYHPLHPHPLTLVTGDNDVVYALFSCAVCSLLCTGFFYECDGERCYFKVHVQCATISEPIFHESHVHPLFLTSKPGERRKCGVCNDSSRRLPTYLISSADETFNCIEECGFSLCFGCATLPHQVRYKHDKHMLTLFYGEDTSTAIYWCESCEGKINPRKRFYKCDENCCVTLHIECLVKMDLYMKPGLWVSYADIRIGVRPNNSMEVLPNTHLTSRPFCRGCGDGKRCPYNFVYMCQMSAFCSISCCKKFFAEESYEQPN